ncbi:MAG: DUF899 domain-containing protein [Acidobacteria bacterium]|nr:MAG: DUF899 domain-containing protein [Acidobacteriota bacterium]REJ98110.1 MAG: DUF899 domain-containing protein [Acidobacteriota bacterium]REK16853.1 MAG: DUF899 domain-containing protein [Acidobacteriota bacterium]REK42764.1 MAG: DUF899 domain-containing protein [Acidobacteriota bacterium]
MLEFPNESEEYRKARNELLKAETRLRAEIEKVAKLRRDLPTGGLVNEDYVFERLDDAGDTERVRLSEMFEDGKQSLLVYNYMFGPEMPSSCPLCTAFLDSISGHIDHIRQRMNLAIVARSPITRIMEFARTRNWGALPLYSSAGNSYNRDYKGEDENGGQWPMANVFVKEGAQVRHFWGSEMVAAELMGDADPRHVDLIWPLWNFFDLTPEGRGEGWYPSLHY